MNSGVFDMWAYVSSTDALSTIKASAYFNDFIQELKVNDWMLLVGTDGRDIVIVTSVTTNVTVADVLGALPPGSVDTADLADLAVTTAKIADLAVTEAKLAAGAVTTGKIGAEGVETANIKDVNVTTAKIADSNVTLAKLATGITPQFIIVDGGDRTTAGGSSIETITVTGVLATDQVVATLRTASGTVRTLDLSETLTDEVRLTFSGDPSTTHSFTFLVFRVAA